MAIEQFLLDQQGGPNGTAVRAYIAYDTDTLAISAVACVNEATYGRGVFFVENLPDESQAVIRTEVTALVGQTISADVLNALHMGRDYRGTVSPDPDQGSNFNYSFTYFLS